MTDRYLRQTQLREIGAAGQEKIAAATVCIIGCGALGSSSAELLVRAGIGHVRIIDRDIVEVSNLQRQALFDENDAARKRPKVQAAARKLEKINSTVELDPVIADVSADNISELLRGATAAVDATDNFETRFLINDACLYAKIPWIYGGVAGMSGLVMPIVPFKGPCLRCMLPNPPLPDTLPACETAGVLASAPRIISSLQAAAILRLIVGDESGAGFLSRVDVWNGSFSRVAVPRDDDCPACARKERPDS